MALKQSTGHLDVEIMAKIAFIGSHCAGKTTKARQTAKVLGALGYQITLIEEGARLCPFPINEKGSYQSQNWILNYYISSENNASQNNFIIMDRCTLDTLPYVTFLYEQGNINRIESSELISKVWSFWNSENYVKPILFYCHPLPMKEDGSRSTNLEFQLSIDRIYRKILEENHLTYTELPS